MTGIVADLLRLGYALVPLQLAYHETGHGLVAAAVGRRVTKISIDRHGGSMTSEGPATPEMLLVVSLAGDRAERLTPGSVENLGDIDVGSRDKADVELALGLIASGTLEHNWILEDAIRQVDQLLTEQRGVLDRLARRLLQHRVLNGDDVHRILES